MPTEAPAFVHASALSVDGLLDLRVHSNHAVVEIGVFAHKDLRVPCHCNKNGIDATAQRRREDFA